MLKKGRGFSLAKQQSPRLLYTWASLQMLSQFTDVTTTWVMMNLMNTAEANPVALRIMHSGIFTFSLYKFLGLGMACFAIAYLGSTRYKKVSGVILVLLRLATLGLTLVVINNCILAWQSSF